MGKADVKDKMRKILDYRKLPFWVMIGAAAVILVLVVCLCSNPGGSGNGAETANSANTENGAEAETDAANVPDVSNTTEEVTTGELTEDGSDDESRKTEWLADYTREDAEKIFLDLMTVDG